MDFTELVQRSFSGVVTTETLPSATAVVRLSGQAVVSNMVGVREAAHTLTHLQDVVSAIGQALVGPVTTRGSIPQSVRDRTELSLFPVPTPGSVQLHLAAPPEPIDQPLPGFESARLIDQAAQALIDVFEHVDGDEGLLVERLQELGPRVTRSLSGMSNDLVSDGIDLDFTWRIFGSAPIEGRLHRREAALLGEVIRRTRVDVRPVTFVGYLVTVSRVQPAAIVLDSHETIPLEVEEELVPTLAPLFDQRVRVEAEETVMVSETTGRSRSRYQLIRIEAFGN